MPVLRSVRSAIAKAVRRAIGVISDTLYSVAGEKPPLVADYVEEYYRGINVASFSDTISHTRSSNATMTDGYGPELVTNGDFSSTDISSLTASNATLSVAHGRLRVQNQTSAYGYAALTLTTEIGKAYILTVDILPGETDILLRVGTTFGGDQLFVKGYPNPDVQEEVCFIATTTTTYIRLGVNSNVNERYVEFDNVSVRAMPVIKWAPHNLLTYSEDLTNGAYNKAGANVTADQITAPDGTMTSDLLTSSATTAQHQIQTPTISFVSGEKYTNTWFVKSGTHDYVQVLFFTAAFGSNAYANFDLSTGAAGTVGSAATASITDVGDDWYRLEVTADVTTTASTRTALNFVTSTTASRNETWGADGTETVYVWGAHLYRSDLGGMVDNPDRGDSYVPTASRPVTGLELLANGSFPVNGDLTGWTTMSASAAVVNNQLVVTDDGDDGTGGRAYYIVATEIGKRYEVSYDKISSVANGASVYASVNSSYGTNLGGGYTAAGGHSHYFTFVATTTTSHIIAVTGSSSGGTATFDNFSVKEVIGTPDAAKYAPRRNHHRFNGTEWVNEGLLHETEGETNLFLYSHAFDNSYWAKAQCSVTPNAGMAPDGTNTAFKIVENSATNVARHVTRGGGTLAQSTQYTASVYLKKGTRTKAKINFFTGNASHTGKYDLENGTVEAAVGASAATIEDVGNGWYRCSVTSTSASVNTANIAIGPLDDAYNSAYDGDGSSYLYAWGAQLETSPHPSSYIPTTGATVYRAIDILQIFSSNLPWPEPEYLGSELLLNSTFDNLDNLTTGSAATLSLVTRNGSNALRVTATSTLQAYARQEVTVSPGKVYHLSCYLHAEVNCSAIIVFERNLRQTGVPYVSLVPGQNDFYLELEGSSDSRFFLLQVGGAPTNGSYLEIDNVSLKEIKPLAVSISMEGKVNYGDKDAYNTVEFYRWYKDATNFLTMSLTTNSSFEGRYIGIHEAKNDYQQVTPSVDTVEPGVNRPYTVACRYSLNDLRMAEQGIVYNSNTAVTHLADLSNSNFELARIYSGTIKNFRIWAEDIGETGLVDATKPSTTTSLDWEFDTQQTSSIDRGVGY